MVLRIPCGHLKNSWPHLKDGRRMTKAASLRVMGSWPSSRREAATTATRRASLFCGLDVERSLRARRMVGVTGTAGIGLTRLDDIGPSARRAPRNALASTNLGALARVLHFAGPRRSRAAPIRRLRPCEDPGSVGTATVIDRSRGVAARRGQIGLQPAERRALLGARVLLNRSGGQHDDASGARRRCSR